ncbi:hypothetical protein CXF86_13935 [Shewanella sp. GutCb]|uniref:ABC-three component system middle component 7 n=1 Tax=Shewanella sp. GutCb TaxID=2058315 RepID=UPI000C7C7312|nr:hypothetical protein CXF86_13935 [Shewanella sp. GutCb]
MITPSKSTPLENSMIYKMTYIISQDFECISLSELYKKTKKHFDSIDEFIWSIDVLYILDKIDLDDGKGVIRKC